MHTSDVIPVFTIMEHSGSSTNYSTHLNNQNETTMFRRGCLNKLNTCIISVVIGILPITFREHVCDTTSLYKETPFRKRKRRGRQKSRKEDKKEKRKNVQEQHYTLLTFETNFGYIQHVCGGIFATAHTTKILWLLQSISIVISVTCSFNTWP